MLLPARALLNAPLAHISRLGKGLRSKESEDQVGNSLRLVHLHVVPRAGQQEELRGGQQLVQALGHSLIQVRVRGAEHDADRVGEPP